MRCGFGALENLKVYSRVCVSNMPAHGCVLTRLKFAARMCVCVCEHVQMQTHCKKKKCMCGHWYVIHGTSCILEKHCGL